MNLVWTRRVILGMAVADALFFGGWIAVEQIHRSGERIKLPVEGYDPRDLLSGHYVRFQLKADSEARALAPNGEEGEEVEVCLEEGGDGFHHVSRLKGPYDRCSPFLAGRRQPWRIDFGVDRFYVDEREAETVGRIEPGPNTFLIATVDGRGGVHPVDLVVNGVSLHPGL